MPPLILIGYMASGKTTLGRALARELHLEFIDTDSYAEQRFHKTISALFDERGEEGFRRLESHILHEVADFEDVVIATGGGAPCYGDNMDYLLSHGTVVWLQAPVEVICRRITIAHTVRPLVAGKSADELHAFVTDALAARQPYYARAHRTFLADELEDRTQIARSVARFRQEVLNR